MSEELLRTKPNKSIREADFRLKVLRWLGEKKALVIPQRNHGGVADVVVVPYKRKTFFLEFKGQGTSHARKKMSQQLEFHKRIEEQGHSYVKICPEDNWQEMLMMLLVI